MVRYLPVKSDCLGTRYRIYQTHTVTKLRYHIGYLVGNTLCVSKCNGLLTKCTVPYESSVLDPADP
jgi:hypothetical protein